MRRAIAMVTLLALVLVLSHHGSAQTGKKAGGPQANDGAIHNWGVPKSFAKSKDDVNAYWIWFDDGVWHFRTTGGGKGAPRFTGKIEVIGGNLAGLKGKKGEYRGKNADKAIFTRNAIAFDFKTDEGVDGLDFGVDAAATEIRFTLAINGNASPKQIRIGKDGDHPSNAVFTVPAHPPDPPEPKSKKKGKK